MRSVHYGLGAAAATLMVVAAACGSDKPAGSGGAAGSAPIAVAITDDGCDPAKLDAAAGQVTFSVVNKTGARAEFEILSSVPQIIAEEFLEAGKSGSYTVSLPAGQYQVICGAPSDPRADLIVTGEGGQAPAAANSKVDQAALAAAVTAYTAYVNEQTAELATGTKAFTDAVGPATSPRPRSSTPTPASRGRRSSRSPSCSPTRTASSTPAPTTSTRPRPTRPSPASTPSSTACGPRAARTAPRSTSRRWPTASTRT